MDDIGGFLIGILFGICMLLEAWTIYETHKPMSWCYTLASIVIFALCWIGIIL